MDDQEDVTEVRTTKERVGNTNVQKQSVARTSSVPATILIQRAVYFIVGVIVAFLLLRIVLLLLAANQGTGFVDFVYSVGGMFAAPFYGIFSYQPTYGTSTLEISSIVAIVVYLLVGWGIAKLLTIGSSRSDRA